MTTAEELQSAIKLSYKSALLRQFYKLLLRVDMLSVPVRLVSGVGQGVRDFGAALLDVRSGLGLGVGLGLASLTLTLTLTPTPTLTLTLTLTRTLTSTSGACSSRPRTLGATLRPDRSRSHARCWRAALWRPRSSLAPP